MVRPNNSRPVSVQAIRRVYEFGSFVLIVVTFSLNHNQQYLQINQKEFERNSNSLIK